jgi:hypothetical protein
MSQHMLAYAYSIADSRRCRELKRFNKISINAKIHFVKG